MSNWTIIVPTMWYSSKFLFKMLNKYVKCSLVSEVILINNNGKPNIVLPKRKIRVLYTGKNMFVNPSWNVGVLMAKTEKILIVNDDILIGNFTKLLQTIENRIKVGMVIGMSKGNFNSVDTTRIKIRNADSKMEYGFGVFMAMYKESYIEVPKEFKVWYGDAIQFKKNIPMLIEGANIFTPMRSTSSKLDLRKERKSERIAFANYE